MERYWDSQFNFRRVLPDFENYLAGMKARSAACPIQFERVQYGEHDRQFVEWAGTPVRVLPVFIHGGYWRALTADMHRFVLPHFAEDYGAVANLEYRLLPEVALTDIVEDALAGLKVIAEKADARLMVIGHSAGGHLAVMSAMRLPDTVCGAVSVSGLYDLTPLPWTFLHEEVGLNAADIVGQSPLSVWDGGPADRVLAAVGETETSEFHRQAHVFASTHGAGVFKVPDAHHMTVLDALSDPSSTLNAEIRSRMHKVQ